MSVGPVRHGVCVVGGGGGRGRGNTALHVAVIPQESA